MSRLGPAMVRVLLLDKIGNGGSRRRGRERGLEREKGQEKMGREREKRVFVLFKQFFLIDPVLLASLKSTRQACNFAEN